MNRYKHFLSNQDALYHHSCLLIQCIQEDLVGDKKKNMKIGKKETVLFLFSDMMAHIELSQVSIAKLV